ncbi:FMN-binding negative transcriptional regulator [Actinotalea sp. BY-33]|uniref:FMN-binding negative transcriptional regulator n=1 Tax=Actinotalea soli TaxID=2819234 RepID=A0A939LNC0_9CELL|nr:FMN-binding negative transcriptional regulator [Actinotalea soli]MBO1751116.1 FMN-binding negative transcriptional regulator [Actinotalea soli]
MWVNPLFATEARAAVAALVRSHSLATIVTAEPLRAAHVPLMLEDVDGRMTLTGHIPRVDPVAEVIAAGERVLCVLHGPRAYVSAGWYGDPGLSTYNFSVAHLSGTASPMTEPTELRAHLVELVAEHEQTKAPVDDGPWELDEVAHARIDQLLPAVLGFRVEVDEAQAKVKLGQNRTHEDRASTREHLQASPREEERAVADLMATAEDAPEPRRPGH